MQALDLLWLVKGTSQDEAMLISEKIKPLIVKGKLAVGGGS